MTFIDAATPKQFECVLYQQCGIALLFSNGLTRPQIAVGYVNPAILVKDIQTLDLHESGCSRVSINLIPKEVGVKDVCIQSFDTIGVNQDELCFKVIVTVDMSSLFGIPDRPHFVYPSMPDKTQVECQEGRPCHVLYEITAGEGNEDKCVTLTPTESTEISNYHIFTTCESCIPGQTSFGNCSVDISLLPHATNGIQSESFCVTLSLTGSSNVGEKRCFNLNVKSKDHVEEKKGCQLIRCKNSGFCDGHIPSTPRCYCKKGYFGDKCDEDGSSSSLASGPSHSFFGDLGIPTEIKCNVGRLCYFPFEIISDDGKPFKVSLGYADPRLSAHEPSYAASANSNTVTLGSIKLNPSEKGSFKVCLQINVHSETKNEMCVTATVSDDNRQQIDTAKPHFLDPTILDDSTIICQTGKSCHIDLYSTNGDNFGVAGKCPTVSETGLSDANEVRIFSSIYQTDSCVADVLYTAKETKKLCFQVSFPGKRGESRCYTIKAVTDLSNEVKYPCSGAICKNGGKCISDLISIPFKSSCVCAQGFKGNDCNLPVNKTMSLQGISNLLNGTVVANQSFDIYAAVPKHVNCDDPIRCCVVVPFHGDGNTPPTLGFTDSDLSIVSKITIAANNSLNSLHYFQTCMKGPPGGKRRLCLQTTANNLQQRINVDEICIEVEFNDQDKGVPLTEHKFTGGLSNGSSVLCQTSSMCHIPIITDQKSGICEQLKECGEGLAGTHVFTTENIDNKCVTNVAIRTSGDEKTESLCISAGFGGEENVIKVITTTTREFSPCSKKHCLNGGRCVSTTNTIAVCKCQPGFSGDLCDTVSTTVPTKNTVSTTPIPTTGTTKTVPVTIPTSASKSSVFFYDLVSTTVPTKNTVSTTPIPTTGTTKTVSITTTIPTPASKSSVSTTVPTKNTVSTAPIPTTGTTKTVSVTSTMPTSASKSSVPTTVPTKNTVSTAPIPTTGTTKTVSITSTIPTSASKSSVPTTVPTKNAVSTTPIPTTGTTKTVSMTSTIPTSASKSSVSTAESTTITTPSSATATTLSKVSDRVKTTQTMSVTSTIPTPVSKSSETTSTKVSTKLSSATFISASNPTNGGRTSQTASKKITSQLTTQASESSAIETTTTSVSATSLSAVKTTSSKLTDGVMKFQTVSKTSSLPVFSSNLSHTDNCDKTKAKEHAKKMVKTGYASCFCMVKGKKMYIIKKRPVPEKTNMMKAAGFGAGGMVGTLTIGVIIYAIVNAKRQPVSMKPTSRPKRISRVRPDIY
ncbi:uncharacterized protein LOC132712939 [Ruditapes philippinarum]|uniref:uncharacterized protein LOC132712939 n=1 Tax=Ruditapes philippinarum TaxID=129788 RepID=UPI00295BB3AE|nr:uncharacterized protein LOC132712939 [Ruditapes philippinarum]